MIKGALRLTKCFALSDLRNRVAFAQRVQVPRPGERAGLYDLLLAGPIKVISYASCDLHTAIAKT